MVHVRQKYTAAKTDVDVTNYRRHYGRLMENITSSTKPEVHSMYCAIAVILYVHW